MALRTRIWIDSRREAHLITVQRALESAADWRLHGLGMAQKYVDSSGLTRVHIWHHSLIRFPIESTTHNHRFGFVSHVVAGKLNHIECDVSEIGGNWTMVDFIPAVGEVIPVHCSSTCSVTTTPYMIHAGMSYSFPCGAFHQFSTSPVAITLLERDHPSGVSSAVFPPGEKPEHAHIPPDPGLLEKVLKDARMSLTS